MIEPTPLHPVVQKPLVNGGPICFENLGVYTVQFESITFQFDYLSPDRDGGVWSEMEVFSTVPPEGALLRARVNLVTGPTRRAAGKDLAERTKNLNYDWDSMIETATHWTLDRVREGEPEIILRDAEDPTTAEAMIPPLLIPDGTTMLFGRGGSLKSYIALALALSLHTGEEIIEGLVPTTQMRVGFCDWEWNEKIHKRRMRKLMGDRPLPDLVYMRGRASFMDERDRLRHIIRRQGLQYLIIDSVGKAAGDDPEAANTANRFFSTLDALNINALMIAHVTKEEAKHGSAESPFGTIFWENNARSTWYIKLRDDPTYAHPVVGLYHRKANEGRKKPPFALEFIESGEDGPVSLRKADISADSDLSKELPTKTRIMSYLRSGAHPVHEIAEEVEADVEAVRQALKRAEGRLFVKFPRADGVYIWGLKTQE